MTSQDIQLSYLENGADLDLVATNPYHSPVSIELTLTLKNMTSDMGGQVQVFLLPPKAKQMRLTTLSNTDPRKDATYRTDYRTQYGDVSKSSYDEDFIYSLPYEQGAEVMIHQGYGGTFSHQGVKALDFNLKSGSKLYAARGGTVIKVEDRNSKGCKSPSCHKYNNMIVILHSDGTMAVYSHLKQNGAKVKEGQEVKQGDFIGLSGATGYVSGPHLHFMVMLARFGDNVTVRTLFETKRYGDILLEEKQSYIRPY